MIKSTSNNNDDPIERTTKSERLSVFENTLKRKGIQNEQQIDNKFHKQQRDIGGTQFVDPRKKSMLV